MHSVLLESRLVTEAFSIALGPPYCWTTETTKKQDSPDVPRNHWMRHNIFLFRDGETPAFLVLTGFSAFPRSRHNCCWGLSWLYTWEFLQGKTPENTVFWFKLTLLWPFSVGISFTVYDVFDRKRSLLPSTSRSIREHNPSICVKAVTSPPVYDKGTTAYFTLICIELATIAVCKGS